MKKIKLLLMLFCLIFVPPCSAYAKWIDLEYSNKRIKAVYVDSNVVDKGSYCTVWIKTVFYKPIKLSRGRNFSTIQHLMGFYLRKNKGQKTVVKDKNFIVAVRSYDNNGKYISGYDKNPYKKDLIIPPNSLGSLEADLIELLYLEKY